MKKKLFCADEIIAKAIEIYNREGGKEWTFEMLDYETSHAYCVKARKELKLTTPQRKAGRS